MAIKNIIIKILDILMSLATISIILIVSLQILARTPLLEKAPYWTEEVSRMLLVIIVSLGSITCTVKNEFVAVDIFTSKLKGKKEIIYNLVIDTFLSIFFLSLIPAGIKFVTLGAKQLSPALRLNMGIIYSFILITLVGMGLAKLYRIYLGAKQLKNYNATEGGTN